MNITLSAEEKLIAKARAYAKDHNTTLNQLIRTYLERISGAVDARTAAEEFESLARSRGGRSEDGFVFNRDAVHRRGERS